MKLSPHFQLSEFTVSQEAVRLGMDNTPDEDAIGNLTRVSTLLEAARILLGARPIIISSGYRSPVVNKRVGGSKESAHLTGRAADFTCPAYGTPKEVARRLSDSGLPFDKLIVEFDSWLHIQVPVGTHAPRKRVMTARHHDGTTEYILGLV